MADKDFFFELLELTDQGKRDLEAMPKVERMLDHGLERNEYIDFLSDLHPIVWHFCPIMSVALSRTDDEQKPLRDHLVYNIGDELDHHELILTDVRATGGDPIPLIRRQRTSHPAASAFVGFNYDAPARTHPAAVLGMLYTLEVVSSVYGGRVAASISRRLDMDPDGEGFLFLSSHATLDQDHMARLNEVIQTIKDPIAQAAVVQTANTNWWILREMMRESD